MKIEAERMIDALDALVFCYGLAPQLWSWQRGEGMFGHDDVYTINDKTFDNQPILEAVWAIMVSLFGDYDGTPTMGWIEDMDGFREFIDDITASSKEVEDDLF